jgi:site-specific DNA-cytosine methylase
MVTSSGYNVRWKVVNFLDYGLAASRKRLIIIASR